MPYNSIFNMVARKQWEGRLNDFLAWALSQDETTAIKLFEAAGLSGVTTVDSVSSRESGKGGVPDLVLRAKRGEEPVVLAIELKLGAFPTKAQAEEYKTWRDALPEDTTAYLLVGPARRADLQKAGNNHFLALEAVLSALEEQDVAVSMAGMASDAREWFVDPEVDSTDLVLRISDADIPYWPIKHLMKTLSGRTKAVGRGLLKVSPSRSGGKGTASPWYGFYIKDQQGTRLGWAGFYLYKESTPAPTGKASETRAAFWSDFYKDALAGADLTSLEVKKQKKERPLWWAPKELESGPWTAGSICDAGFDRILVALHKRQELKRTRSKKQKS